jgi:rhomboid protease GluP
MQRIKLFLSNISLTYLLIGFNVVVFVITYLATTFLFQNNDDYALRFLGAEFLPDILNMQLWRLVTATFLHAGILHLAFNMWALYSVGPYVEKFYGKRKLFLVYILTGIGGSLLSLAFDFFGFWSSQGTQAGFAVSVGASGAIFGLIGLLLGQRYRKNNYAAELNIDTYQLWLVVIYNFLLGFGLNIGGSGININNWAHLGGLFSGFLFGLFLDHKNTFYRPLWKIITENSLFIFSLLIFIASLIANLVYTYFTFVSLF